MGKFLVHHEGKFLEWSTVVDAPITVGMSAEGLTEYVRWRYGQTGLDDLPNRMRRAVEHGTSCVGPRYSFDDLIPCNRAGVDETELSRDQLVRIYFSEARMPDRSRPEDWGVCP